MAGSFCVYEPFADIRIKVSKQEVYDMEYLEHIKMIAISHPRKWDYGFIAGVAGSLVNFFFGGWTLNMKILFAFMAFDVITGMLVAGVFKKSPKTNGALKSDVGRKGIVHKILELILVSAMHLVDLMFGYELFMQACIIGFIGIELISIVENIGLVIELPPIITKAIQILNEKAGNVDENITDRN